MEIFLIIIQCIGAVSFTISATIYAIHKRADVIGALVFSLLTCFGGGFIRDLALGNLPPSILSSKVLISTALLAIVVCLVCYHRLFCNINIYYKSEEARRGCARLSSCIF